MSAKMKREKHLTRRALLRRGPWMAAAPLLAQALPAAGQEAGRAVAGAGSTGARKLNSGSPLPDLRSRIAPIPAEESVARQDKARQLMEAAGIDAVLLTGGTSLRYFLGFNWGRSERVFAAVLPRRGEIAYVCPAFERRRAEEQIRFGKDLRTWEEDQSPYRLLRQVLDDRGARRVGIEETVSYFVADGLAREAPGIAQTLADPVTAGCRSVKSERELALMRVAAEATRNAILAVFAQLKEGMTAREIADAVTAAHRRQGVQPGFALVALGPFAAFPHGSAAPQKLRENDVVLIDSGCSAEGYQSDVTRTTVFGRPSEKQRRAWEIVRQAQAAALAAARPGATAESVDAAARAVIEKAGWGPGYRYFTHRLGHGIGMDGHEWPYLVRGNKLALEPSMTFSDEPGIYIEGEFGVRLEDVMVMTETGARLLTLHSESIEKG